MAHQFEKMVVEVLEQSDSSEVSEAIDKVAEQVVEELEEQLDRELTEEEMEIIDSIGWSGSKGWTISN